MPSSFSILERSDRLPRHQTSNNLLIFFQNSRPSSLALSVEDDELDEDSGLVSRHIKFVLLVNLGGMFIKTLPPVLFLQSAAFLWLAYKAVGMQSSTLSACTHCSSQLQIALAWKSSSTHETGFSDKLGTCPLAFLVLAGHQARPRFQLLCRKRQISLYNFCSSVAAVVLAMFFPPPLKVGFVQLFGEHGNVEEEIGHWVRSACSVDCLSWSLKLEATRRSWA